MSELLLQTMNLTKQYGRHRAVDFFSDILTVNDLTLYLERTPHTLVGLQYELFSNT